MTFYEVLEIDGGASTAEVERAFRRMARKVHPDLNAGDRAKAEARMKLLNEIRDTLTDPLLRAGYDERLRLETLRRAGAAPPRAATPRPAPAPARGPAASSASGAAEYGYAYVPAARTETRRRSHTVWVTVLLAGLGGGVLAVALVSSPRVLNGPDKVPEPFASAAAGGDAGLGAGGAPLLATPVMPRAPRADTPADDEHAGRRARNRGVVLRIGSTTDDVLRALGQPDSSEPGRHLGESVLHFGSLHLEMKNGRVVGGDAAAR